MITMIRTILFILKAMTTFTIIGIDVKAPQIYPYSEQISCYKLISASKYWVSCYVNIV